MTAVAVRYPEIKALGVEVLSISTDSVFSHKIWQEGELARLVEGGLPYPMLADLGGKIGMLYGVYDEAIGMNLRGRFLIDPDGVIQSMEVLTDPVGRSVNELIRQIRAFQHARATGEVAPCEWQPGGTTLNPGVDLAGNVWKAWKPNVIK